MTDLRAASAAVSAAHPGSSAWLTAIGELAEALLADGDLDAAIDVRHQALARLDRALTDTVALDLVDHLGVDLMTRYGRDGRVPDLRKAVELGERTRAQAPPEDQLRAASNLAGRLAAVAGLEHDDELLERALRMVGTALDAASDQDPARFQALSTLAGIHVQLWQTKGDRDRMLAAVRRVLTAIDTASGPPSGPTVLNLAALLCEGAEETADEELLTRVEDLVRSALDGSDGPALTALYRLLANALFRRHEWTGSRTALTGALEAATAAVDAAADLGGTSLASALSMRGVVRTAIAHADGGGWDAAAEAVQDAREALAMARGAGLDLNEYLVNLASCLAERYDLIGDGADLDASIGLLDEALAGPPPADSFASVANDQAAALLARYERDLRDADLDRGVVLAEAAVTATGKGNPDLAARHDTAGRLRAARAHHRNSADDLAAAEAHSAAAVAASAAQSPDRAIYLNNWAMWVTDRWDRSGSADALEDAIQLLERALAVQGYPGSGETRPTMLAATTAFNLAARLQEQFEARHQRGDADLDLLQRAVDLLDDVLGAGYPHLDLVAGKRLGDIAWRMSFWSEGEHAFRLALGAAGILSGLRPRRGDKERARSGVQGLGALAALCAARAGNLRAAAVHLEQASATLIAEAVGFRAEEVTFDGVVAGAVRMDRHVLLLGCTPAGGIAVLVSPQGEVSYKELPRLTEPEVAERVRAFRTVVEGVAAEDDDASVNAVTDTGQGPYRAAAALGEWTGDVLVTPVIPRLSDVDRVAVLPLGRLAWLPITTVAPVGVGSGLARHQPLLLVRATPRGGHRGDQSGDRAGRLPSRVVVWADTGPPDRSIPGVIREARRVAAVYGTVRLTMNRRPAGPAVTPALVLRSGRTARNPADAADAGTPASATRLADLMRADLVHLACHCDVDVDRPQETVLQVVPPIRVAGDDVGAIGRTHVVLSACDAARTAASLPDEALSAATAFLLAGAGVVTAPLWPVVDAVTPGLMAEYHQVLAAGSEPAAALARVRSRWAGAYPLLIHGPWVVTAWPDAVAAIGHGAPSS